MGEDQEGWWETEALGGARSCPGDHSHSSKEKKLQISKPKAQRQLSTRPGGAQKMVTATKQVPDALFCPIPKKRDVGQSSFRRRVEEEPENFVPCGGCWERLVEEAKTAPEPSKTLSDTNFSRENRGNGAPVSTPNGQPRCLPSVRGKQTQTVGMSSSATPPAPVRHHQLASSPPVPASHQTAGVGKPL